MELVQLTKLNYLYCLIFFHAVFLIYTVSSTPVGTGDTFPINSTEVTVTGTGDINNRTENAINRTEDATNSTEDAVKRTDNAINRTVNAINRTDNAINRTEDAANRTEDAANRMENAYNEAGKEDVIDNKNKPKPGKRKENVTTQQEEFNPIKYVKELNHDQL